MIQGYRAPEWVSLPVTSSPAADDWFREKGAADCVTHTAHELANSVGYTDWAGYMAHRDALLFEELYGALQVYP